MGCPVQSIQSSEPAAAAAWQDKARKSLGRGDRQTSTETLGIASSFGRWVEVLLEGPSDQDGKGGNRLSLKLLRWESFPPVFVVIFKLCLPGL